MRAVMAGAKNFAQDVAETCAAAGIEIVAMIEGLDRGRVSAAAMPPVIWVDEQSEFEPDLPLVIGIGQIARRAYVERLESEGRRLLGVRHPSTIVSPSAVIEEGCVLLPGVIVAAGARIGRGTVLNRACSIGHHTTIGPWSFVGPGASVAGEITMGEQVYIAVGATVRDMISIGDRAVVGAGAAAVSDVPADTTVVGVPARPIERH
ncbi:MAG TPA: acetyltransferase [Candidatus Limnocylindrales bacterium]|nr:acetyltransferase [Candidatus Limnocylindrales bacterium]